MKTYIAAWIAAIFMGVAFVAMPTIDAQDEYLQAEETAAERVAKLDREAEREASELARQYQEMDDREIMRGVVYEPESR
ncbi:hypothetical protein [Eikenella corrodens]|uniref:hypothetical protein n=1 Tax=Eikenella corrodens TaxID=539 RepID=UPI0028E80E2C|nr:hypothetical protein [Eikenella corrodens]